MPPALVKRHRRRIRGPGAALVLLFLIALAGSTQASLIVVDSIADDIDQADNGNCTLREALVAANTNSAVDGCNAGESGPTVDVVSLPAGTYVLAVGSRGNGSAASGDLDLTDDLRLEGAGADVTIIDAGGLDRVFDVVGGIDVTIVGLHATGGDAGSGNGGAVENDGTLTLEAVILSASFASGPGGGVRNNAMLTVRRSTVFGNTTEDHGGGLDDHGTSVLENSTFSGNDGGGQGGGVYNLGGESMTMVHCTLEGNIAASGSALHNAGTLAASNNLISGSCSGVVSASGGGNLEGPGATCGLGGADLDGVADLGLGLLQGNGGATPTHALTAASLAVDFAVAGPCLGLDQRGITRPQDGDGDTVAACDTGAFELVAAALADPIFSDGFENGDLAAWSSSLP